MRLFYKTLYLFITIIILLSVSTTVFITQAINENQSIDASRELTREASAIYDAFNHWKLLLWRYINLLAEDEQLNSAEYAESFDDQLISRIQRTASRSGIDYAVIHRIASNENLQVPIEAAEQPFLDIEVFKNRKEHPYIEIIKLHNTLYFTGIVRLGSAEAGTAVDVFLIKMIDRPLLERLTSNQRIKVLLASASEVVEGTMDLESIPPHFPNGRVEHAYTPVEQVEMGGQNFRGIIQHSGTVAAGEDTEMLTLMVFLSLSDYESQVQIINQAILTIALIAALVTIILSSIFSKNLTYPIHRVVQSMQKIKSGDYQVSIASHHRGEIGDLLDGFNEMTAQLALDKQTREENLQQIMRLKVYNEDIIDAMPEGLIVVDKDLKVEKVNHAYLKMFSLAQDDVAKVALDTLPGEVIDAALVSEIRYVLSNGKARKSTCKRAVAGRTYELNLYPLTGQEDLHCIVVIEDISERIAYEQKIFQAERLASISLMTAGMAHEINNPLSSILSNTQNLIHTEADLQRKETLNLIEMETKRIARIVRGLLDFSTTDGSETVGVQVNETIGEITRLIGYSLQKEHQIILRTDFDASCPLVAISGDELKQVILNLVRNAMQSISGSGTVSIATRYLSRSESVEVSITDDGSGIEAHRIQRIFDPFYTTKQGDVGSGLGLSVVYGIVKKYKGEISVSSTVGEGTRIAFQLPIV
ncbi:sensor histidine kinase [Pleomorphochaeta sp. DL1XJH-081]|uniref:sensor histidine kinase n=1 Tax=Pleomorphochaeta sp. DL1XJH-081 TaxID=3409690 RepID=UPI003BB5DF28